MVETEGTPMATEGTQRVENEGTQIVEIATEGLRG